MNVDAMIKHHQAVTEAMDAIDRLLTYGEARDDPKGTLFRFDNGARFFLAKVDVDALSAHDIADAVIASLNAAGYRILGPDEVDPVTLERAAALCLAASVEATNPSRACQADELGEAIRALGRKA